MQRTPTRLSRLLAMEQWYTFTGISGQSELYQTFPIANAMRSQLRQNAHIADKYKLYLPTEQQLIAELKKVVERLDNVKENGHGNECFPQSTRRGSKG